MSPDDALKRAIGSRGSYTQRGYAWRRTLARLAARPVAGSLSLLVLGIVLALPVLLTFLSQALDELDGNQEQVASLTAYLDLDVSDLAGADLAGQIASRTGVQSARYISRDEALATFAAESDLGDALDVLESNPLPGAIIILPDASATGADRMQAIADEVRLMSDVDDVRYDLQWVERLQAVVSLLRLAAILLTGFLTMTALLVIANTIRLELLDRRAEREVCHLLGASRRFMNRPFLYTGMLYGLAGGVLAMLMAAAAFALLKAPADQLSRLYGAGEGLQWPGASLLAAIPLLGLALGLMAALSTLYGPSQQKILTKK